MTAFERGEFLVRLQKTKQRMGESGIELLLVSDPSNLNYLTGYDASSYYVHQVVVVALEAEEPLWIGRKMDVACARYTAFLQPANIIGYPEDFIGSADRHVMEFVADTLRARGWATRRLGVEMDSAPYTPRCDAELRARLPEARFFDANLLVNWVRIIKSPQEIAYMKQAATLSERAMQTAVDAIAPGVRECDVAAKIYGALIAGAEDFEGHLTMNGGLFMPSGEKTSAPHLGWTSDRYRKGAATNIELGGCRHGYHAGLARTVFLGGPPSKLKSLAPVVVEGMAAALDRARAGVRCEDVEAAWRQVIQKAGWEKESRIGYSIGIGYPHTSWIERTASLRAGDHTLLEPNMTFHMILGMWMDDWGFELSETFRVTEHGEPEVFSRFPRELIVKH